MDVNLRRGGPASSSNRGEQESPRADRDLNEGAGEESEALPRQTKKKSSGPWILVVTIVVVLIILGFVFRDRLFSGGGAASDIAVSDYQAVFLTNGQVYFGSLSQVEDDFVNLRNIYYLQVTPTLQTQGTVEGGAQPPQQQLSLVKLGNELHGPVDEMFINRDHILFIEDLKDDGRVVQAIKDFEDTQSE